MHLKVHLCCRPLCPGTIHKEFYEIFVALSLLAVLTACAPELTAVAPPPKPTLTTQQSLINSGAADKREFVLVSPDGVGQSITRLVTRDRLVYSFTYAYNRVYFTLKNTDIYPVTINWSASTMTDASGTTAGIFHDKIALTKVKDPQKPTVVEPGATLEDFFAPVSLVVPNPKGAGVIQQPLLSGAKDDRSFTVNLHLNVNQQPLIHTFTFKKIHKPG